jgi:O-acetyl-ADP-ribose deacetylase (regulator of RNase III)
MNLKIFQGDVLEAEADAILMTIDGSAKGMEGNICAQFKRRWPEVWEEIDGEMKYPLALGNVFDYEPVCESPFRLILLASTLHHRDMMSENEKKHTVKTALENTIRIAVSFEAKELATGILRGGWRLSDETAFIAMADACESAAQKGLNINLGIYIPEPKTYELISSIAGSVGWGR